MKVFGPTCNCSFASSRSHRALRMRASGPDIVGAFSLHSDVRAGLPVQLRY